MREYPETPEPVLMDVTRAPVQTQRPLVSIVIACYNHAHYLSDAIESALRQTYSNLEIIVIDDGSTDNTPQIAKAVSSVRYIRQQNLGLAAARNAGLSASHGHYILFLDADDRLLPKAVQAGMQCFQTYPDCGFVIGEYRHLHNDGSVTVPERDLGMTSDYYWHLLRGNFIGMHATVMYSREVLQSVGGFDGSLRAAEDYDIYLRIARRWQVKQHGALVAEYRKHGANMSANGLLMLKSVLRVLQSQRASVLDRRHRDALRLGTTFYREYYGDVLIDSWRRNKNLQGLLTILRWHPLGLAHRTAKWLRNRISRVGTPKVNFGSLRRLSPISRQFGFERGQPIDRRYIESFLSSFAADIQGQVLEIGDDSYSRTFGGTRITGQDVLHVRIGTSRATITGDLADAPHIPSERFDCIILTQTLNLIYDVNAALMTLYRILKPGGTLLATMPGISQIYRNAEHPDTDSWRFTISSARRLFGKYFGETEIDVKAYGNVLAAAAFLYGIATSELESHELDYYDADYPVIVGVRARKRDTLP
jgi:glycosyltransferase involved in cell wall biosynthesis